MSKTGSLGSRVIRLWRIAAVGAALSVAGAAHAVTIANPSFETTTGFDASGPFITLTGAQLPGWTIGGSIDDIGSYWTAQNGSRSIDLNGNGAGTISQTLTGLSAGTRYIVSFFISGNPDNSKQPNPKTALLTLGSTSNMVSYMLSATNSTSQMNWQNVSYSFVADNSGAALLQLASTQDNPFGLAVDNFSISAAPEPAVWAMLIFGFGLAGAALRRRRAAGALLAA